MLTYWITNTGEVTSYCFMTNSSAASELSDNRKGFKDSFYFKKNFPTTSRRNADRKSLTCGKDTEFWKTSCRDQGPRNQIAHLVCSPQADKYMCVSWQLVWKLLQCFFKEKKNLKTWKRNYFLSLFFEETSRLWVKMAYLVRKLI